MTKQMLEIRLELAKKAKKENLIKDLEAQITAININELPAEKKEQLATHLMTKYADKLVCTIVDRLEGLKAGYPIDKQVTAWMDRYGVTL